MFIDAALLNTTGDLWKQADGEFVQADYSTYATAGITFLTQGIPRSSYIR